MLVRPEADLQPLGADGASGEVEAADEEQDLSDERVEREVRAALGTRDVRAHSLRGLMTRMQRKFGRDLEKVREKFYEAATKVWTEMAQ